MTSLRVYQAGKEEQTFLVDSNLAMALETEQLQLDRSRLEQGVDAILDGSRQGFYLVAQRQGRRVGCALVTIEPSDWRNGLWWWLQSVYVLPGARRQGVFRALHGQALKLARERGDVIGVRLYVDADNATAQATYQRLGMARARYHMYEQSLADD